MKKTLLICGVLLAFAAPAFAQYTPGIDLHWNDCVLGATAAANATWGCNNNASGNAVSMTASFVTPGLLPNYVANTCILDLQTSAATLSPWWHMESPVSTCPNRAGRINTGAIFTLGSCSDFWGGTGTTAGLYQVPSPGLLTPNSARYKAAVGVAAGGPIDNLDFTDPANPVPIVWYALTVNITKPGTLPLTVCPGCNDGACIVLNEMLLSQPAPVPDVALVAAYGYPGAENWVTYKGGAATHGGVCPGDPPTPTRKTTWGSVKALYR